MSQLLQVFGALMILAAFVLAQLRVLKQANGSRGHLRSMAGLQPEQLPQILTAGFITQESVGMICGRYVSAAGVR